MSVQLDDLIDEWKCAKREERNANAWRLQVEEKINQHFGVQTAGMLKLDGITITYGLDRKWDQAKLTELKQHIKHEYWPFRIEWKEDKKAADVIAERFPELWKEIQTAFTTKPKKPSFSIKE